MTQSSLLGFLRGARPFVKLKVLALLFCAAAVISLTLFSVAWIFKQRHLTPTEQVLAKSRKLASVAPDFTYPYEIKDMSIPLTNRKHTRSAFAQFTLILDCPSEEAKKSLIVNLPKVLDTILVVGSGLYVEDFAPPLSEQGFARFKTEIKTSLSAYLQDHSPREILIKDWFIN
jgi:hypothetical protein